MIPSSSFCFLCCVILVAVWSGLHFRIHVYCLACAMRMLRLGYLFWCNLCFRYVVVLLNPQSGQQGLHFNLYVPLDFNLFSGILSWIWLYNVLLIRKVILNLVFFNKLGKFCTSGLWNLKVTNYFFCCICVGATSGFFVCVLSILFFSVWIICNGKPSLLSYG